MTSPTDSGRRSQAGGRRRPRFRAATHGEVAIEYGLIVALVVVALLVALPRVGTATIAMYNKIQNAMSNSGP